VTLFEKLWSLLPDRCQMPGCDRSGVRGKEKIIDGLRMCYGCLVKNVKKELERSAIAFERRLSFGDASRGKYGFFFDEIMKRDEQRMTVRLALRSPHARG
jgi:hypothetical protein